jgi:hypothetical protein
LSKQIEIILLKFYLKQFDITWKTCPNIHVFGLTTEGEEITQPCPLGGVFSGNDRTPALRSEIAQKQLRLLASLPALPLSIG